LIRTCWTLFESEFFQVAIDVGLDEWFDGMTACSIATKRIDRTHMLEKITVLQMGGQGVPKRFKNECFPAHGLNVHADLVAACCNSIQPLHTSL
jgi:hypothetical protein